MNSSWRLLTVVLVVFVVLAMATVAMAGPNGARPDRPFKADFGGTRAIVEDPGRCDDLGAGWIALDIYIDQGHATHLGPANGFAEQCINGTTGVIVRGEATYFAANGDELYATYTGAPLGPGLIQVDQIFDGGTGRFEYATGFATEIVTVDAAGTVQGTIDGIISY